MRRILEPNTIMVDRSLSFKILVYFYHIIIGQPGSVLHYGAYDFALNYSFPVITSKNPNGMKLMGNRYGFSQVKRIKIF